MLLAVIALRAGLVAARRPASAVALLLVLGTAAFSGLGLLMAGTLKAEATLAAANLVFLLLLVGGGRDRTAGQVPRRRPGGACSCCRSRRCRTGCARCSSTAPGCRGATWGSSRSGRCSGWARRRGSSAGSSRAPGRDPREGMHKRPAYDERVPRSLNPLVIVADRWQPSPKFVRRAALATVVMAVVIVVTGGAVRLTESGLGCPTWPTCTGAEPDAHQGDGRPRDHRVHQPHADVRAVRGRRPGDRGGPRARRRGAAG